MAKKELFENPIVGWYCKSVGAFPVHRGKPDIASIKKSIEILKEGKICGVFPEGTRKNRNAGKVLSPKSGAAFIAYKANSKVLPVYITQDHKLFNNINVVIGEPFKIVKKKEKNKSEVNLEESAQYIMDKIYELKEVVA